MIKLTSNEATKIKLQLTLSEKEWTEYVNNAYESTKNKFNVAGFRKGKVPKNIIEKTYGANVFYDEAINKVINKEYAEFLMTHKDIEPYSQPEVAIKSISEKGLDAEITTILAPKCELGAYTGLNLKAKVNNVKASEIEDALKAEQNKLARFEKTNEPSKLGDIVNINFEGFVDDVAFEGGKADKFDLELGSKQFIEGFEDQLVGTKAGDTKEVKVKFPEDYHADNLANKNAVFKCKVNEVKAKIVPELNDKFVSDISEFNTLEEYKADIKNKLLKEKNHHSKHELEDEIVDKIVANSKYTIDEVVLKDESDAHIHDIEHRLADQGINVDVYCKYLGITTEKFYEDRKVEAEKVLKMRMALRAIIEKEKFNVEKADIINALKEHNENLTDEAAEKYYSKMDANRQNMMANDAMMHKVLHFLTEKNVAK